jgi:nicotinamidase-related amidase
MTPIVAVFNLQNEIVHRDGAIGALGNAAHVAQRRVLENTAALVQAARRAGVPVIYIGSGYDESYSGLNRSVPLFSKNEQHGHMQIGTWSSRFHEQVAPEDGEVVLYRSGLGAFAATPIGDFLPPPADTRVYVAGVSTRLVVEAAVFEFTDRGYAVSVVEDCCAAATDAAHEDAIAVLRLFAAIESASQVTAALSADGRATAPLPHPNQRKDESHG